jgi:putative membrane protein
VRPSLALPAMIWRMSIAATVALLVIAVLHTYILVLEMFLWTTPRGRAAFGTTPELAEATKPLAANQGLYNGFLAAGLFWAAASSGTVRYQAGIFFLACVAIAGVYGALTASRRIIFIQTVPALIGLALVLAAH